MLLHNRVCVGEWARIGTADNIYEGRVHAVSGHRVTIYNDPSASALPHVSPAVGPVTPRKVDVLFIEVSLGR